MTNDASGKLQERRLHRHSKGEDLDDTVTNVSESYPSCSTRALAINSSLALSYISSRIIDRVSA
jgi:hypothetical protein